MARPSSFSQEVATIICDRLAEGKTLRAICQDEILPSRVTVQNWVIKDVEGFAAQYARARDVGLDVMADELFEIADDGRNDTYTDENGNVRTDQDVIARSRLRVDTRKWYLSKMAPKKYGDKQAIELTGAEGAPVTIEHRADRVAELMALAASRKAKYDEAIEGLV